VLAAALDRPSAGSGVAETLLTLPQSSGGAPFTLSIMANALRIGAGIAARARRREL